MSVPIAVELKTHDPAWAEQARQESTRIAEVMGETFVDMHHIGSTAIAGIHAKAIIDLLLVVASLEMLDKRR